MNEREIREILINKLSSQRDGQGAAFIPELFLNKFARRADLVMANGKLSAFEIKSPLDTLDKLPGQLDTYVSFFESVTIVCAEKHLQNVMFMAPEAVGVWVINENQAIKVVKKAQRLEISDRSKWLSFLPVDELRQLMRGQSLKTKKPRDELTKLCDAIDLQSIRSYVLAYLKRRHERIDRLVEAKAQRAAQWKEAAKMLHYEVRGLTSNLDITMKATPRKLR